VPSSEFCAIKLGAFPAWLDALAAAHPSVVVSVLRNELSAELAEPPTSFSSILQNVRGASPTLAAHFLPALHQWLASGMWRNGAAKQAEYHSRLRSCRS
jgi:hypothetical protein